MYRLIEEDFIKWKERENHKPLLLSGSRQVGRRIAYSILLKSTTDLMYILILKEMMISKLFSNRHQNRTNS